MPRVGLKITLPVFQQYDTLPAREVASALIGQILLRRWNPGGWNWRVQLVQHDCGVKMPLGNLKVHRTIMLNIMSGRQAGRLWTRNEWFRTAFSGGTFEWAVDTWNLANLNRQSVQELSRRVLSQSWMLSGLLFHQYEDLLYHLGGRKLQCSDHQENVNVNSQVCSFHVN